MDRGRPGPRTESSVGISGLRRQVFICSFQACNLLLGPQNAGREPTGDVTDFWCTLEPIGNVVPASPSRCRPESYIRQALMRCDSPFDAMIP